MDRTIVDLPQPGGCICRAVRYSLNGAPLLAYVCHCHDCQSISGSAFILSVVVRGADLAFSGPVETFTRHTRRNRDVSYRICAECRCGLTANYVEQTEFTSLRAGSLDDASWVRPIAQTNVASALPWAVIPGVEQVDPKAFDYAKLSAAWLATAPVFAPRYSGLR